MSLCDLCNASVDFSNAERFPSSHIKSAVNSGLRPPETVFELLMMFGLSKSHAEQEWIDRIVTPDKTYWLLCGPCASKCNEYLETTRHTPPMSTEEELVAALKNTDGHIRLEAVQILGKKKIASAVESIIERLLEDNEAYVRWNAAESLGKIMDSKAIDPLIAALSDTNYLVVKDALNALRQFKEQKAVNAIKIYEETKEDLLADLANVHWQKRLAAVRELGNIKQVAAVEALIELLLKDKENCVRWSAAEALGKIKVPKAIKPLVTALNDEDRAVAKDALSALSQFEEEEATAAIKEHEEAIVAIKEQEEAKKKKERILQVQSEREASGQCIMCGKKLEFGFFEKFVKKGKNRHPTCSEFME